jgi:uncharacterized oligopeptide transporter (OPT) family protein
LKNHLTLPAIIIGILGAILVSASSFYIVLKFGALPWPTIMVTLISMSALNLFKRTDLNEITITHTIMSAGSMVAGGVAFTIPGYLLLGGKLTDIDKGLFTLTLIIGSILGAILSFLFRKKLIEDDKLEFPIGEAAYELVIAGSKKVNMYFVTIGAIFSSVVALFRDYSFKKGSAPLIPTLFSIKNTSLSFYVSPLLVGIGYILGFANTFSWFVGGALTYLIAKPLAINNGIKDFETMKNSFGMGFMIGIGVSIILGIIFSTVISKNKKNKKSNFKYIILVIIVSFIVCINIIYKLPIFLSLTLILICILCTIIAGYTTGKTGINPMEIYAIITILVISFLNSLLNNLNIGGKTFHTNINLLTLFLLAGIVAIACGLAGDILNDFKSGYKLKTDPKQQLIGELIGALVSSFVISFLFFVFFNVYKNIGPQSTNPELIVLQASIVASVVHGIPFIKIFWIGLVLGMLLNSAKLPVLTFGIGVYLPFYLTIPVFLGGLISLIINNFSKKTSEKFLLLSNGLMAGEAIVGVIISILAYIHLFN